MSQRRIGGAASRRSIKIMQRRGRRMAEESASFAIVRNIPRDAGSAQYHEVEAIEETDSGLRITTDN